MPVQFLHAFLQLSFYSVRLILNNSPPTESKIVGLSTQGYTPLMAAARTGQAGVVELLLERGASMEATRTAPGMTDGGTAWHYACDYDRAGPLLSAQPFLSALLLLSLATAAAAAAAFSLPTGCGGGCGCCFM